MPLTTGSRTAVLSGVVTVEEAEPLAAWLRATPRGRVNLRDCTVLHTAAVQALAAARIKVSVPPTDDFLRRWVLPVIDPGATTTSPRAVRGAAEPAEEVD